MESHNSPLARRYCLTRRPSSTKPNLRYSPIAAVLCGNTSRHSLCSPLIPPLVAAGVWRHLIHHVRLRYEPGLWSIVFPVGMVTTDSAALRWERSRTFPGS